MDTAPVVIISEVISDSLCEAAEELDTWLYRHGSEVPMGARSDVFSAIRKIENEIKRWAART